MPTPLSIRTLASAGDPASMKFTEGKVRATTLHFETTATRASGSGRCLRERCWHARWSPSASRRPPCTASTEAGHVVRLEGFVPLSTAAHVKVHRAGFAGLRTVVQTAARPSITGVTGSAGWKSSTRFEARR